MNERKQVKEAIRLAESAQAAWLRKFGRESMGGNCAKIAAKLQERLAEQKINASLRTGWMAGSAPGIKWSHTWLVLHGVIIDPTAVYFDETYPIAAYPGTAEAAKYLPR